MRYPVILAAAIVSSACSESSPLDVVDQPGTEAVQSEPLPSQAQTHLPETSPEPGPASDPVERPVEDSEQEAPEGQTLDAPTGVYFYYRMVTRWSAPEGCLYCDSVPSDYFAGKLEWLPVNDAIGYSVYAEHGGATVHVGSVVEGESVDIRAPAESRISVEAWDADGLVSEPTEAEGLIMTQTGQSDCPLPFVEVMENSQVETDHLLLADQNDDGSACLLTKDPDSYLETSEYSSSDLISYSFYLQVAEGGMPAIVGATSKQYANGSVLLDYSGSFPGNDEILACTERFTICDAVRENLSSVYPLEDWP